MDLSSKSLKGFALDKLNGKWLTAIAVTFVAGLLQLGGHANSAGTAADSANQQTDSVGAMYDSVMSDVVGQMPTGLLILLSSIAAIAVIWALVSFLLSGAIALGVNLFFIKLCRDENVYFSILFSRIKKLFKALGLNIVMGIFIFLWSLLLIIPGIIASYRYSMALYIMAEKPETKIMEALKQSKEMMVGHKMELFVLHLSFIGWIILCIFTLGLGFIVLEPYMKAAEAAFYVRLSDETIESYPEVALQQ